MRCAVCGLPFGRALAKAAEIPYDQENSGVKLKSILEVECGYTHERLCCREEVLARWRLACEMMSGAATTNCCPPHPNPIMQAWLRDVGPFAFYGRAADELLAHLKGYQTMPVPVPETEQGEMWVRVEDTTEQGLWSSSGTYCASLVGSLFYKDAHTEETAVHGVHLGQIPIPGPREPLTIRGHLRAPLMHTTFPRNSIGVFVKDEWDKTTSSSPWSVAKKKKVEVVLLSSDTRCALPTDRRPDTVLTAITILDAQQVPKRGSAVPAHLLPQPCEARDFQLFAQPTITVRLPSTSSSTLMNFGLRSCMIALGKAANLPDVARWCARVCWAESTVSGDLLFVGRLQRVFLCCWTTSRDDDSEKLPKCQNIFPWVRAAYEDETDQATGALRTLVRMVVAGLEVLWGRRAPTSKKAMSDCEGVLYALECETAVALRIALQSAARFVSKLPQEEAAEQDREEVVDIGTFEEYKTMAPADRAQHTALRWESGRATTGTATMLDKAAERFADCLLGVLEKVWRNTCEYHREDIHTLRVRKKDVAADTSRDLGFGTIIDRHVSSHDMNPRNHDPRDDGFIDGRDTTDSNPGRRAFMCVGAVLSRRVPLDLLSATIQQVAEALELRAVDVSATTAKRTVRYLSVNSMLKFVIPAGRTDEVESECRRALRADGAAVHEILHEASVEVDGTGNVNVNGQGERLLRPVQLAHCVDSAKSWRQLLDDGVVKWMGQDEQLAWAVLPCAPADDVSPTRRRFAWEIDAELRCGYRVIKVPQRQNGHPSRLHYFVKLAASSAASPALIPGKGKRFIGNSSLAEGSIRADPYDIGTSRGQEGQLMTLVWANVGGSNHEDSLATTQRALRLGGALYREIEVVYSGGQQPIPAWRLVGQMMETNEDVSAIGEDGLPSGRVQSGQPLCVFLKVSAGGVFAPPGRRLKEQAVPFYILRSPVDGEVVAARVTAMSKVEVVVRQRLEPTEGMKIGFPWQKMTATVQWRPLSGSWLDVSAASHPASLLSRQSAGLLTLGLRNMEAAGSFRLTASPQQREPDQLFWDLVDCPDVPHTGECVLFDDFTGDMRGRHVVVMLRASQAALHHPRLAISGRCAPDADGRGPRQEPLLRMLLSSLGYNPSNEEHAPSSVLAGGDATLFNIKVCKDCMTVSCPCRKREETEILIPESTYIVDALARQQDLQMMFEEGEPVPSAPGGRGAFRVEGKPAPAAEVLRGAERSMSATAANASSVMTIVDGDDGSFHACFKGRGARLVGRSILALIQETMAAGVVAVENADERGRETQLQNYSFRSTSSSAVQSALSTIRASLQDVRRKIAKDDGGVPLAKGSRTRRFEVVLEAAVPGRLAANIARVYARDLLPCATIEDVEIQGPLNRSLISGRLVPGAPQHFDFDPKEMWREAHYEKSALLESLSRVKLRGGVGGGDVIHVEAARPSHLICADELVDVTTKAPISDEDTVLFPAAPIKYEGDPEEIRGFELKCKVKVWAPADGSAVSALPHARLNHAWSLRADVATLRRWPKETARLLGGNVCHRGLLKPDVFDASDVFESNLCDGCGACASLADHMPILEDIEDMHRMPLGATRLPLRGALKLEANVNVVALECSTGEPRGDPRQVLLDALDMAIADWAA